VKVDGGVGLTDGVTERVGGALLGEALGLGDGKTTRDGAQSRTNRNTATITTPRSASRATVFTR
jgi:hypothetical protein